MSPASTRRSDRLRLRAWIAGLLLVFTAGLAVATEPSPPGFSKAFAPDAIGPGSVSMLIFTIDNSVNPTYPVEELAFSDTLPAEIELAAPAFVSSSCDGTVTAPDGGSTISLVDGKVGAGLSCEIVVNVTSDDPGEGAYTNTTGDLTSEAGNSGTASAGLTVDDGLPGFSKSFAPPTVDIGGRSTLTFTIDNTANASDVGFLGFDDSLPAGMVVADPALASTDCGGPSAPPTLTASPGSSFISLSVPGTLPLAPAVAAEDSCTVTVDVIGGAVGSLGNVTSDLIVDGGTLSAGKAAAVLEVTGVVGLLELAKEFVDDPVTPGGMVTLEFTVTNRSRDDSAAGIAFADDLDAVVSGLVAVGLPAADVCGAGSMLSGTSTLSLTGGSLPPEGSCTFSVGLTVDPTSAPGTYSNSAGPVTGDVGESMETGNVAGDLLFIVAGPEVTLSKEFTDDPVGGGGGATLSFTITNNNGTSALSGIEFTDDLNTALAGLAANGLVAAGGLDPEPIVDPCGAGSELTIFDLNDSGGLPSPPFPNFPPDPTMLIFTGGSLAAAGSPGDSCTFVVAVDVPVGVPGGVYTNTSSEVTGELSGPVAVTGDPASDDLVVVDAPSLSKEFTDDPVLPSGGPVTLELTLEYGAEEGAPDATAIAFSDDLTALSPAVPGLVAASVDSNGCAGSTVDISTPTLIAFSGGSLAPGESCTVEVTLTVPASSPPGFHTNVTSEVTATVGGAAAASLGAEDDLLIAQLAFSKEFTDDPVISGAEVTLEFTIENLSPMDGATAIGFSDSLDTVIPGLAPSAPLPASPCGAGSTLSFSSGTLTLSGGEVPSLALCSFSVTLLVPVLVADGSYLNATSSLTASVAGPVTVPPATDSLAVESNLLTLSKEFTDDPVEPGDPVTLELILTNLSATDTVSGIAFDDDLDATLSGLVATGAVDGCGGTLPAFPTGLFTYTGGSLAPGASCTITLDLDVPPAPLPGSVFPNTTTEVSGTLGGLDVFGAPAGDDLRVNLLTLTKSFDGPTTAGGAAVLSFTITNLNSGSAATGLAFSDDLGAVVPGLEAVLPPTPDPPCGAGSALAGPSFLAFTGGSLTAAGSPGDSCSFDVSVTVPGTAPDGAFVNTTSELFQEGLPVADAATALLTIAPPPEFGKMFAPDSIVEGGISTLTFTIDNTASVVAAGALDFTDTLPAGVVVAPLPNDSTTCVGGAITAGAGAGVISYSGGSVAAGASCTVEVDVTGDVVGMLVNTSGDLTSSSGNSGTASDTLTVSPAPPLFGKAFVPGSIGEGGVSTLVFTIDNGLTEAAATGLDFTDALPAGMVVASPANASTTCTGGVITAVAASGAISYTGGSVAALSSCTVSADVTTDVAGTADNTSGDLTSSNGNSGPASASLTVDPDPPGFAKAFDPDNIVNNGVSTLTFTIDNSTTEVPATGLDFTDNLPPGVVVASPANASTTCTGGVISALAGGTVIAYSGGTVAALASCTVEADVTSAAGGEYVNTTGDLTSSSGNSGTASDTLTVAEEADLELVKTDVFDPVMAGGSQLYELTATNMGPSVAENVVIEDPLPPGTTFVLAKPAALCAEAGGLVTCAVGDLAAGESSSVVIRLYVELDAVSPLDNLATVSADTFDPDTGNNDVMESTEVIGKTAIEALADVDGNGLPELAVALASSVEVLVKDVGSFAVQHRTEVFPAGWKLADFAKVPDLTRGGDDLAVLAVGPAGEVSWAAVEGDTGETISGATLPPGFLPLAMAVVREGTGPLLGTKVPAIVVAAQNVLNGLSAVFVYNARTGGLVSVVPLGPGLWPIDLAGIPSIAGNVFPELGILLVDTVNGFNAVLVKQLNGAFVNVRFLPGDLDPFALATVPNCCGLPADELAALVYRAATDQVRVRTTDADSGALVSDDLYAVSSSPAGLRVIGNFGSSSADELVALFATPVTAAARVRDAMTGVELHAAGNGPATGSVPLGLAILPNAYGTAADELAMYWQDVVSGSRRVTVRDPGSGTAIVNVPIP